jgi:hypothetical protein
MLQSTSVSECTSLADQCLNGLLPAEREDWNRNVDECLKMQACGNFSDCFASVPGC